MRRCGGQTAVAMKKRLHLVVGVLLVAALGGLAWWALGQPRHETGVRDLNPPDRVVGCLGKPLGSRLAIEGVSVGEMGGEGLRVTAVNGRPLKRPVWVGVRGDARIEEGKQYRLEGYESGAFGGPPDWTAGNSPPQQPFQFYYFFVVTKVLETKAK
jgi:hypothetical protein